jgi:hypothetical protein
VIEGTFCFSRVARFGRAAHAMAPAYKEWANHIPVEELARSIFSIAAIDSIDDAFRKPES